MEAQVSKTPSSHLSVRIVSKDRSDSPGTPAPVAGGSAVVPAVDSPSMDVDENSNVHTNVVVPQPAPPGTPAAAAGGSAMVPAVGPPPKQVDKTSNVVADSTLPGTPAPAAGGSTVVPAVSSLSKNVRGTSNAVQADSRSLDHGSPSDERSTSAVTDAVRACSGVSPAADVAVIDEDSEAEVDQLDDDAAARSSDDVPLNAVHAQDRSLARAPEPAQERVADPAAPPRREFWASSDDRSVVPRFSNYVDMCRQTERITGSDS